MALSKKQLRWSGGREKLMVKQEMWLECSRFDWKIFLSHSGVLSEESAKKEEWKKPNVQALCSWNTTSTLTISVHCVVPGLSLAVLVHSGCLRLMTYLSQA